MGLEQIYKPTYVPPVRTQLPAPQPTPKQMFRAAVQAGEHVNNLGAANNIIGAAIGVKPTVAARVVSRAVQHPVRSVLRNKAPRDPSRAIPVWGGRIEEVAGENVLPVYHGTANVFEHFDPHAPNNYGIKYDALGRGVNLSVSKSEADAYARLRAEKMGEGAQPHVRMHAVDKSKLYDNTSHSSAQTAARRDIDALESIPMSDMEWRNARNAVLQRHGYEGLRQQNHVLMFDPKNIHNLFDPRLPKTNPLSLLERVHGK